MDGGLKVAKIGWKNQEQIEKEKTAQPSEFEKLKAENEQLKKDNELNAMAIMELTEMILGG